MPRRSALLAALRWSRRICPRPSADCPVRCRHQCGQTGHPGSLLAAPDLRLHPRPPCRGASLRSETRDGPASVASTPWSREPQMIGRFKLFAQLVLTAWQPCADWASWPLSRSGMWEILRTSKYNGYLVWNRRARKTAGNRGNPPGGLDKSGGSGPPGHRLDGRVRSGGGPGGSEPPDPTGRRAGQAGVPVPWIAALRGLRPAACGEPPPELRPLRLPAFTRLNRTHPRPRSTTGSMS